MKFYVLSLALLVSVGTFSVNKDKGNKKDSALVSNENTVRLTPSYTTLEAPAAGHVSFMTLDENGDVYIAARTQAEIDAGDALGTINADATDATFKSVTVSSGGLSLTAGDVDITGDISATGTTTSGGTLTVSAGGADITGDSTVAGDLGITGDLTSIGTVAINTTGSGTTTIGSITDGGKIS